MSKPTDLVQGTLDLLSSKPSALHLRTDGRSLNAFGKFPMTCLRLTKVPEIPPCPT